MARKTSFYVSTNFVDIFDKYVVRHGSPAKAITYGILCLDTMYRLERRILLDLFTQEEVNVMLNSAKSSKYDPQRIVSMILTSMEDELQSVYDSFGADKPGMLKKLRSLTISQQYALIDWLMELRGPERELPCADFHSAYAMKDGKPYMLKLSNEDTEIVLKSGGMRDIPEKWYLFICPPEGGGRNTLAEIQPESGEWPNIKELAEANGFEVFDYRAFA